MEDSNEVLKHPHPQTPFLDKGTTTNNAISKVEKIFGPPREDNNLPRVQEDVPIPRVLRNIWLPKVAQTRQRLEAIDEEPTIYPIGTVVRKKIGWALQWGTVARYDEDREYYWIDYKNGNSEEMTHQFVIKYKCVKPNTIWWSCSEQIGQQQANTTIGIPVMTTIP